MDYIFKDKTYFAIPKDDEKDRINLEIGDSKQINGFLPQVKIMRWDNEVNISLRLVHDEINPVFSNEAEKIKWEGKKISAEIYPVENGQEFEIILKEKPASNVIKFTVQDKGVNYFYQSALTKQEIEKGGIRPENVVGSYAVYAAEHKVNILGGKEYKAGKIGHIYRPKIVDSAKKEVWGDLHIENGILSVTIPQNFLDNAVYPVRHAAGLTFGYTTHGASSDGWVYNYLATDGDSVYSPASNGNLVSITQYSAKDSTAQNSKMAIYNTSNALIDYTGAVNIDTLGEYTANVVGAAAVNSAVGYKLCFKHAGTIRNYYDSVAGTYNYKYVSNTYASAFPDPVSWTTAAGANHKYSIWATYTAGGFTTIKSVNGLVTASIKSVNGLAIASVKSINGRT